MHPGVVQSLDSEAESPCVYQTICLPESILNRGGEGAMMALVLLQILKVALVLFVE